MSDPADADEVERARGRGAVLFDGVVALEGSISGEHGIGFSKAPFLALELSPDEIALMKRVKQAFDPHGILNPGKIFPVIREEAALSTGGGGGSRGYTGAGCTERRTERIGWFDTLIGCSLSREARSRLRRAREQSHARDSLERRQPSDVSQLVCSTSEAAGT